MSRFTIRPQESRLWARASSTLHPMGYSAPVAGSVDVTVVGETFALDPPAHGELRIDLRDLKGEDSRWDSEMLDRLDARRHPTVTAEVSEVQHRGSDLYRLRGFLTLRGHSRPLLGDATVGMRAGRMNASGRVLIDVRDFGIEPPRLLMLKVSPEVEVAVSIVADPEPERP